MFTDTTNISVFQPIGDAAEKLRTIVPHLHQLDAVKVLETAERDGHVTFGSFSVTFREYEGWCVVTY